MPKVTFTDKNGVSRSVEAEVGSTLMETALRNDIPGIEAECGGACACATCHVYVNDGWFDKLPKPSEAEIDMLDMALAVEPNSRLSCQIICGADTDSIKVTVAPE